MLYKLSDIAKDKNSLVYVNLTNGIEAMPAIKLLGIEPHYTNIQSTNLEQHMYDEVIERAGADLLMNLAIGKRCYIIDYGTRKKNSRAIYMGVPLIKYCCERAWFGNAKRPFILCRGSDDPKMEATEQFERAYCGLSKQTRRAIKKFKKYTEMNEHQEARLFGLSKKTVHDGDNDFYISILRRTL